MQSKGKKKATLMRNRWIIFWQSGNNRNAVFCILS